MLWGTNFVFIHIPRTGGTSLEHMFGGLGTISKIVHLHKHAPASQAKSFILPSIWKQARKFTIYRCPWDITVSWYKHLLSMRGNLQDSTQEFREYCLRVSSLTFNEYLNAEIFSGNLVRHGGYLESYLDVRDRDKFLILDWEQAYKLLCEMTGYTPEIQTINSTQHIEIDIPKDRKPEVLEFCYGDRRDIIKAP